MKRTVYVSYGQNNSTNKTEPSPAASQILHSRKGKSKSRNKSPSQIPDTLNCPKPPEGISFTYKCNKQKQRITFENPGAAEKKITALLLFVKQKIC